MDMAGTCKTCARPLASDAPEGLCPACLMKVGIGSYTNAAEPSDCGFVPLAIQDLAPLFPQLEVLELLGKGGMGAVYKARQKDLDRLVALKILPARGGADPGFAERFTREARALARLNHPNIVAVHEFGQAGDLHYFIMEYVDGTNLRQIERSGGLEPRQALAIIPQICEALQFAHDAGVVHRDIKPENILLDKKGHVKIADFGLAKILGRDRQDFTLTQDGHVMGTPHYMAPEQVEHPQAVDHRADIYSLGVVFYEMLTGELPMGKFQPPSAKVQIDVRLDEVVLKALAKEPDRRYQQASQVRTEVETIAASGDDSGIGKELKMKKGIPGPLWIAIVSLGLMVIGKVILAYRVGPLILIDAALSGILLFGVIVAHRWAYVLTLVFTAVGTVIGLSKGIQSAMAVLVLDCLVLIPVLICTSHFFAREPTRPSRRRLLLFLAIALIGLLLLCVATLSLLHGLSTNWVLKEGSTENQADSPHRLRGGFTDRMLEVGPSKPLSPWAWDQVESIETPLSVPPVIVKTVPESGTSDVDPDLAEIQVTFSKPMLDGSWSWVTLDPNCFPQTTGKYHYLADGRTCVMPVKIEPGKIYALWLNSQRFQNFRDRTGLAAVPYLLIFKTRP